MTNLLAPRPEADPMEGAPIRCTVEMAGDGTLTLLRAEGCTEADARDLCALVGRGDAVIDRTPNVESVNTVHRLSGFVSPV